MRWEEGAGETTEAEGGAQLSRLGERSFAIEENLDRLSLSVTRFLRDVDNDVQEGKRSEIGIKRKADSEPKDVDARAKFERAMDSTKEVGSKAIGVGQAAVEAGEDLANRTTSRLQDAYYKVRICVFSSVVQPLF